MTLQDTDIVIVGAARTPFGKLLGGLAALPATDLGAHAIRGALEQARVEPDERAAVRRLMARRGQGVGQGVGEAGDARDGKVLGQDAA